MARRVIACCSSQPQSLATSEATFRSIVGQTVQPDEIIWNLPLYSVRQNKPYPEIPEWIHRYPQVNVNRCLDTGPSTKVTPLLDDRRYDDASLLVFDDDTVYPSTHIENLLRAQGGRNIFVGYVGNTYRYIPFQLHQSPSIFDVQVPTWYNRVSVLLCSGMVLFPRSMLPHTSGDFKLLQNSHHLLPVNDDLIFAIFANKTSTPMHCIAGQKSKETRTLGCLRGINQTQKCHIELMSRGSLPFLWSEFICILVIIVIILVISMTALWATRKASRHSLARKGEKETSTLFRIKK
jgi:hypothetical protein